MSLGRPVPPDGEAGSPASLPDSSAALFPPVSLLLLTKNHLSFLKPIWDVLLRQDYPGRIEIVSIDSGSTDGGIEFLEQRGIEVHCIPPEEFHHARTRNLAASRASHGILVLLSADALPVDEHWLSALVSPFQDSRVGAVYGKQIAPPGTGTLRTHALEGLYPDERQERYLPPGSLGHLGLVRFSNANSAVRTELWRQFQFHERVLVAEDHWICYNALKSGMKVIYEPGAAVIHGHERTLWNEFRWAVDNGISLQRMGIFDDARFGGEFRYGFDRVRKDWAYFTSRREYVLAVRSFLSSMAKWIGVQIGKREAALPRWFLRRVSASLDKFEHTHGNGSK